MKILSKRVVADGLDRPSAVQVDYADFLRFAPEIAAAESRDNSAELMAFAGTVKWGEDGLEYQKRLRAEWE